MTGQSGSARSAEPARSLTGGHVHIRTAGRCGGRRRSLGVPFDERGVGPRAGTTAPGLGRLQLRYETGHPGEGCVRWLTTIGFSGGRRWVAIRDRPRPFARDAPPPRVRAGRGTVQPRGALPRNAFNAPRIRAPDAVELRPGVGRPVEALLRGCGQKLDDLLHHEPFPRGTCLGVRKDRFAGGKTEQRVR